MGAYSRWAPIRGWVLNQINTVFPFPTAPIVIGGGGVRPVPTTALPNGEVSVVEAQADTGDTWYKMKQFMRQPWFIGTMGGVAWIILLIVVVLLYRQRRSKKKAQSPTRGEEGLPFDMYLILVFGVQNCLYLCVQWNSGNY